MLISELITFLTHRLETIGDVEVRIKTTYIDENRQIPMYESIRDSGTIANLKGEKNVWITPEDGP